MHVEVSVALNFVISYLYNKLPRRRVDLFGIELEKGLKKKFEGHWYPDQPVKGSGFRCVRVNGETIDPVVTRAAECVGINLEEVKEYMPNELTLWIDPNEVSYRIGEKSHVQILYSNKNIEEHTKNEDTEIGISTPRLNPDAHALNPDALEFNPDAQSFELIDKLSASLGTLNVSNNSEGLSPMSPMSSSSSSSWGGSQSTSPLGGPPFPSAFGTLSPQSTVLTKRPTGIPMFTTATFAQTKFGSTKLKSSAKRPTRLSPIEFGNVFHKKTIANSLQYPGLTTPPRSRSLSPHDPILEFLLDQQQRILHSQQQQQLQQQYQQQQRLIQQQQQQLQQNRLSIPSDLFLSISRHCVGGTLSDTFVGSSPVQSPVLSAGTPASSGLYSSQLHLASAMSGSHALDQQPNRQGHSTFTSVQTSPDDQMALFEDQCINNAPHSSANQYHQLLLAS